MGIHSISNFFSKMSINQEKSKVLLQKSDRLKAIYGHQREFLLRICTNTAESSIELKSWTTALCLLPVPTMELSNFGIWLALTDE